MLDTTRPDEHKPSVQRPLRDTSWWTIGLVAGLLVYVCVALYNGLVRGPGPHDNDWPLLMWLAHAASWNDLSPLAVGHYGFLQLVLVRYLGPLFASVLVAAKVLNVLGTVVAALCAYLATHAVVRGANWGFLAAAAFVCWPSVFLNAQSEFGDPLALGMFAFGAALCLRDARDWWTLVVGGLCFGLAGCIRLHMQTFAIAALLPFFGMEASLRGTLTAALKTTLLLAAGVTAGLLPVFAINIAVHRTLASPVATGLVGQVVFGSNPYDMANTYALHPMSEMLREHKAAIADLMCDRILACPPTLVAFTLFSVVAILLTRNAKLMFVCLLALGYYAAFVALAWAMTPRLLEPFIYFTLIAAVIATALLGERLQKKNVRRAGFAACLVLAIAHLRLGKGMLRAERTRINNAWNQNVEVEKVVYSHGASRATDVFVSDWWIHPVSDPRFIPYYNFGFWDLLVPTFARERPNPYPELGTLESFVSFLRAHAVKVLVFDRTSPLPQIAALCDLDSLGSIYRYVAQIGDQCVFAEQ